jgi:two-component system sensor kinase FixL
VSVGGLIHACCHPDRNGVALRQAVDNKINQAGTIIFCNNKEITKDKLVMGKNLSHNQRNIYQAVTIVWLVLLVTVMSWIVMFDLQRAETLFTENANLHYQQANNRVNVTESILEGFSAVVSVTDDLDRERIRSYAQKILEKYPHIFMFEIVEKVPHKQIELFTEYYRKNIYPDFEVKGFSYEAARQWHAIKAAPYHMPIVFMEPCPEESRKVLGLDLGSNEFFMRALQESEILNQSISSDPFKLVEGELAYIIHKPVPASGEQTQPYSRKSGADGEFAVLVIRADTLLDTEHHPLPGMRELLYRSEYEETDPRGYLHLHEAAATSWLESKIFPRLRLSMALDSASQPFILLVEHQLGWGIISWGKLGLTLLIALLTFRVMTVYARLYFRYEMARAKRFLQIAKAIIIGLDRDGNINLINRRGCEILGYTEKEILGRNWFETALPDNRRDEVFQTFRKIIDGETEPLSKNENEILTKNKEIRYIDWNNAIEKNSRGEIIGTLSSGQDITERKQAEEEAQRMHQEFAHVMRLSTMGEMASGMAHELNQPLTALVSYCATALKLAKDIPSLPKGYLDILDRASGQAHRAGEIIRHLREFVSKGGNNKTWVVLDELIPGVIKFIGWELRDSDIQVTFLPGSSASRVLINKVQIEQVLINLIRNSIEAIRGAGISGGQVDIATRLTAEGSIEISVADNGPGIDPSMSKSLFEPYQTSKETGMGMGLSISRSIIEAHDGTLRTDERRPQGALFCISLPGCK